MYEYMYVHILPPPLSQLTSIVNTQYYCSVTYNYYVLFLQQTFLNSNDVYDTLCFTWVEPGCGQWQLVYRWSLLEDDPRVGDRGRHQLYAGHQATGPAVDPLTVHHVHRVPAQRGNYKDRGEQAAVGAPRKGGQQFIKKKCHNSPKKATYCTTLRCIA